jgi:hypothetical protein
MTGREAVGAPRLDHQWLLDRLTIEDGGLSDAEVEKLRALGDRAPTGRPGRP